MSGAAKPKTDPKTLALLAPPFAVTGRPATALAPVRPGTAALSGRADIAHSAPAPSTVAAAAPAPAPKTAVKASDAGLTFGRGTIASLIAAARKEAGTAPEST